ncbi:MAG: PIG-L family deacetylase [Defluviitaleaceae bacterium]|nr:PIG-L family deacetylase [Defluviitaleaceae bacterium]
MFINKSAEIFAPNQADPLSALSKTTDLCIGAHHDDIEIMAYGPISKCYGNPNQHFTGVVVTDGDGSPRTGVYANYTAEDMKEIRAIEQKQAAHIGRYHAQVMLAHKSSDVKNPNNTAIVNELKELILACSPEVLYTHNLADKHDTHVAVCLQVIRALREIPQDKRPKRIESMEVWRGLDWLCDEDKVVHDTSAFPNISAAILGVFDSQISGGKRYDLATQGRRLANATFFASHAVDAYEGICFGLDITELINNNADPSDFIVGYIDKFKNEVERRVAAMS